MITTKANPQIKTVKFEARPMWETAIHAKPYSAADSPDALKKANYQKVKEILNDYACVALCNATKLLEAETPSATYDNLRELYLKSRNTKDKEAVKKYEKATNDFKKHIVSVLTTYGSELKLVKEQGSIFDEKKSPLLKGIVIELTDEEKEQIKIYHGFLSYFKKYFDSLAGTIICGTKGGSIANRIIECLERYIQNEAVLSGILAEYPDLYELIRDNVAEMDMSMCVSQDGIDAYNMLLGDTKLTGINSIINEYRQKNKVRVAGLKQLDKIPMCKKNKQIVITNIETDQEMIQLILGSFQTAEELFAFAKRLIATSLSEEETKTIYLKTRALSKLSMPIYNKWNTLSIAVEDYCKANDMELKDSVSLYVVMQAIKTYEVTHNCSVMDAVKDMLAEALKAEKKMPAIKEYCKEENIRSHKKDIKEFSEGVVLIRDALKVFCLETVESSFIEDILSMQDTMKDMSMVLNYEHMFFTREPINKGTYPLYFNKPTCLNSFDYGKFLNGESISSILRKDGLYYLLILNPAFSTKLSALATAEDGEECFEQLVYKQITGLNKMFPKMIGSKKNQDLYEPTGEIIEILENKLYTKEADDREACVKWIRYCIECFKKTTEWMKYFNPTFRKPEEYESANEFYTELERYTIHMDFSEKISYEYLRKAVSKGEVFLFQIYSLDFSPYHKGKDSIYKRLLTEMFSAENLNKINNSDETALKLASGGSTLTFRRASLPYKETHPANMPIQNKNPLNPKKQSTFEYGLCKDKRFMQDKYMLSLAIQVGFRNEEINRYELNRMVNAEILKKKPNILAIRAGERHLLYYIVSDPDGNILEQDSLNILHTKSNQGIAVETNHKELLQKREMEVLKAKEEWDYSQKIDNVKTGYMSQAIHVIMKLREKYDAVIFVEDYNGGFVQKRRKNLQAVYQQFQVALLKKLSCYVPEGKSFCDALQLAYPISSLDDLKGQSGIVYFVNPAYTSNVDPQTGFVNRYYEEFQYKNLKKAEKTLSKIKDIRYNEKESEFEVVISDKDFGIAKSNREWVLHTKGIRSIYQNKKSEVYDCTEKMSGLFKEYQITGLADTKERTLNKGFYEKLFEIMNVLLRLNYYSVELEEEYTLSPVEDSSGTQFDSRNAKKGQPVNTAAVKTYLMLKKGMRDLEKINEETLFIERDAAGTHGDNWIAYLQTSVSSKEK